MWKWFGRLVLISADWKSSCTEVQRIFGIGAGLSQQSPFLFSMTLELGLSRDVRRMVGGKISKLPHCLHGLPLRMAAPADSFILLVFSGVSNFLRTPSL